MFAAAFGGSSLNRLVKAGARRAAELEDRLAALLVPILNGVALRAARAFEEKATDHLKAAGVAGDPFLSDLMRVMTGAVMAGAADWTPPVGDELIDVDATVAQLRTKTDPVRVAFVEATMTPALEAAGLAWDVTNPYTAKVLQQSGSQVTNIVETTRTNVNRVINASYEQGLSIPDTAKAIRAGMPARCGRQRRLRRLSSGLLDTGGTKDLCSP